MHAHRAPRAPASPASPASPADRERAPGAAGSGRYLRWLAWSFLAGLTVGAAATLAYDLPSLVRRPPCLVGLLVGGAVLLMLARRGRARAR